MGTFLLRVGSAVFGIAMGLALARLMGVNGFGAYMHAMAWLGFLSVLSTLGFGQFLIREVSTIRARSDWARIKSLLRVATWTTMAASLAFMALAAGLAGILLNSDDDAVMLQALLAALLLLPLANLAALRQAAMRGLDHIIEGQLPELVLAPLVFTGLVVGFYFTLGAPLSPLQIVVVSGASTIAAAVCGSFLLARRLPPVGRTPTAPGQGRLWLAGALPFLLIGGLEVVVGQTDLIMIGAIAGDREVGQYAVAARAAGVVMFVWAAVNTAIGPKIAEMHSLGDRAALQKLVTNSANVIFVLSALVCVFLFIFAELLLGLFGEDFKEGATALRIITFGQFVNASAGSVGLILKMTGYEKDVIWTGAFAAAINVVLNALLIPHYGINGAAIGTTASLIVWPIFAGFRVYFRLGLVPVFSGRSIVSALRGAR